MPRTSGGRLRLNLLVTTLVSCILFLYFSVSDGWIWFGLGLLYANLFEYSYHRFVAHNRSFKLISVKHRYHHATYNGETARTKDPYSSEISEEWYFFPVALTAHFLAVHGLLGWFPVELGLAFVLHYTQYEVFHWATHYEDSFVDRILLKIPVVAYLRATHIRWHLEHHDYPPVNFNFSPPYLGDLVWRTQK